MKLTGQHINHINSIAHDGKVLVVGTAADGAIFYSVKRSGFEDSALAPGAAPFGFEEWKPLRLGEALDDPSVTLDEQERLTDPGGTVLVRSVYGAGDEATHSADAPVQLVSLLGHLYVFRQSPGGKLLVNRFVLDGMLNELVPKYDVRFRRSKQRLVPLESVGVEEGTAVDSLDYRDMDGNAFFEPALELGFIGTLTGGWFSVVCVQTSESDRGRWHIFTGDAAVGLVIYSIGSTSSLPFDVGDHLYAQTDPDDAQQKTHRSIPGITRRALALDGLAVAGRPSATLYDLQTEQLTDAGMQLLRGATRAMLAVPVRAPGDAATRTAALSFGIAADGTLSRIDPAPDAIDLLCSDAQEVLLPLDLLDDIREVATTEPPPVGTIAGIARGDEDRLAIRSREALSATLAAGQRVKLRGTQSYDGHYTVMAVAGATFEIEATFERDEPGFWEVIPDEQTGLVFDNMIVGYAKTPEGKLQISCPAHDLKVGDEVQISGTHEYDGTYPVIAIDAGAPGFTLDAPFFTGEAANLSAVTRRGLRLDGDDHLETPSLGHAPPSRTAEFGRTLSTWLWVDKATAAEQELVAEAAGLIALAVGADDKLKVEVRMSDGSVHTVTDPATLPTGAWVHVAGTLAYDPSTGGETRIALCRDGVQVAQQAIGHAAPCHLRQTVLDLSSGAYCDVAGGAALFAGRFTVACWANVTGGATGVRTVIACHGTGGTGFHCRADAQNRWEVAIGDGVTWATVTGPAVVENTWTHLAATWDGATLALYVNGVAAGTLAVGGRAPTGAPLRFGAGGPPGAAAEHLPGQLADVRVWSRALAANELAERMALPPKDHESSLTGYWPLDDGTPTDRSLAKRHGAITGTAAWPSATFLWPAYLKATPLDKAPPAAAYSIGRGFCGELADVQIWELARSPEEIADTRYLQLTGAEHGLAASYRLGAIVYEEPPIVPDFSIHSRDAVVYGDPYAGARRLDRATGSGMKCVAYASDEVVAVAQRATYEESFEFLVSSPDAAFDPADADGTGRPLFTFSYWGKASQTTPERIALSPGSYQQADFVPVGGGWYRASCRVTVPDGVPLLRAFEISDVRGTWGAEPAPPTTEWTAIDIRKHRLRMISDVVTREGYTDRPALEALPAQAQAVLDELEDVRQAEAAVARIEATIADLELRLEVANNNERYVHELEALENTTLPNLKNQRSAAQAKRDAIVADEYNYYQEFQAVNSGLWLTSESTDWVYQQNRYADADRGWQRWKIQWLDATYCTIALQQNRKYLEVPGNGGDETHMKIYQSATAPHQQWKLEHIDGPYYYLRNKSRGLVADVYGYSTSPGAKVHACDFHGKTNQRWHRTKTPVMTEEATDALADVDADLAQLDDQIAATEERIAWLKNALASQENPAELESQLAAARTELGTARTTLGTQDQEFLAALGPPSAGAMPVLATDDRGLVTTGALLDFVQPIGGVRAVESCEGNVQLSYIDRAGRLRLTCYDAAADSRNTTFEQWLPDAARACANVLDSGDRITLAEPVTLPASGATCEAWFRWPAATQATGSAYDASVVVSGATAADAPLLIRGGNRLGLRVDGWYFDAGIDLSRVVATGWHHFAASTRGTETGFFIDGVKVASRQTEQPALRFDGATSYLEVPAYNSPTAAVTVSVWAHSAGATWNDTSNLASKRDAFIIYPVQGSKQIKFYVHTTQWQSVEYTPADIQGWHHYTGTYDGHYLRLYIDGVVVVEKSVTGPIKADNSPMYIGYDATHRVPFKGDIAEVAVWSTARTLDEVSGDLYRSPAGNEPGLVGCWRMERIEDAGNPKIRDVSPYGRHALLRGAPLDAAPTTQRDREVAALGNAAGGGGPIGRLAEVRLWSAPLSDDEVAANARAVLTGHEPGLLAYWPLDEGTGTTARDRTASGAAHGTLAGVDWAGCTANLGNPGGAVLSLPERGGAYVTCPTVALAGTSFTVELWARRSGANQSVAHYAVGMGTKVTDQGLHIGFRNTNVFTMAFYNDDLDTTERYTDIDWHHWCCVYDQPTRAQRIYRDGVQVAERTASGDFTGTGELQLGRAMFGGDLFLGELADVRIWNRARTEAELRADLHLRLSGTEAGLLAYYPLDAAPEGGKVLDRVTGAAAGTLQGTARLVLTTELPSAGASDLVTAEYSTVEATAEGTQQALMRRCLAFATAGQVGLVPELRIEELILQWVGNTQINPTLIGYIEGAPPVPSENLTVEGDYDGAATVSLMQSRDTVYTFQRTKTRGESFESSGFIGGAWARERGKRTSKTTTEGEVGAIWSSLNARTEGNQSTTESSSTHTTTDRLTLSGRVEDKPMCADLGPRYVPKNTGYALVVSGTADVFVTRLVRSGRMVGYDIRPLEGVPLDINTITFLINPAYVLNGTLDGLVGSTPADPTFYTHVPSMRSQYGSKYPASYFRIEEAYELAERINRMDMERESFFYNFDAREVASFNPSAAIRTGEPDPEEGEDTAESVRDRRFEEAQQRLADIEDKYPQLEDRVRASEAFAAWQYQMAKIQTQAGKRNVVNTYVWDGDGGLRAEEQGFANTVEHSLGVTTSESGGGGGSADVMVAGFKFDLSLVGSGSQTDSSGKMLNRARTLQLSLDLSRIERKGITDLRDNPLVPGEKVDRYRFMSFYLEGDTKHFHDFFAQVVDPEWLISNDEEARALRQTQAGKPNRCWRVLHRVTYVERPALMNLGQEAGTVQGTGEGAPTVEDRLTALEERVAEQGLKLDEILRLLTAMAPPTPCRGPRRPAVSSPVKDPARRG
ncbi:MAG TPA: LamG-like jellyroll fold domain-containing protein, partial [Kofleriaceae bacterium]|nr:LamG-like jellyroll fold domain-containing protein [Kofleriaceae bacterium]